MGRKGVEVNLDLRHTREQHLVHDVVIDLRLGDGVREMLRRANPSAQEGGDAEGVERVGVDLEIAPDHEGEAANDKILRDGRPQLHLSGGVAASDSVDGHQHNVAAAILGDRGRAAPCDHDGAEGWGYRGRSAEAATTVPPP